MREPEDNKFGGAYGGYTDFHNHPAFKNILGGHSFTQSDMDKIGLFGDRSGTNRRWARLRLSPTYEEPRSARA